MWVFTNVADWVNGKVKRTDGILDNWVEDSKYSQWSMVTAASVHALTNFGSSMTDVMRLGDGVKKGGWGYGEDAMRFVAIFPVGKAAQLAKSAMLLRQAKLIQDIAPRSGICSWVGTSKALVQTGNKVGGRLLATVEDLANAAGVPVAKLSGISLEAMGHNLRALGAKVGGLHAVRSIDEIVARGLLRRDGSVVLISVRSVRRGLTGGHMFYAFYDAFGRLRFMDRTIGAASDRLYATLEEIAKRYQFDEMAVRTAMPLYNVFAKHMGYQVPTLALPIKAVVAEYVDQKPQGSSKHGTGAPATRR
jgi:hypothetical protein